MGQVRLETLRTLACGAQRGKPALLACLHVWHFVKGHFTNMLTCVAFCESPLYWHACMCGTWGAIPASFVRGGLQIGVRSQPLSSEVVHILHV